ncbi:MAG: hypothetical protein NVS4B11_04100 [Ktedonobacteraceae bacterium]
MAAAHDKVTSYVNDNKHIYNHLANITTLVLWTIALGSHAILIPLFIREVIFNKDKSSLFR